MATRPARLYATDGLRWEPVILSTEHAASSYGQPVIVTGAGLALGPGDAVGRRLLVDPYRAGTPEAGLVEAAQEAGYQVEVRAATRDLVSLADAAAALGLSDPAVLRQAIARGAMAAQRHGRDWWVTPEEVERYRRDHRRG